MATERLVDEQREGLLVGALDSGKRSLSLGASRVFRFDINVVKADLRCTLSDNLVRPFPLMELILLPQFVPADVPLKVELLC